MKFNHLPLAVVVAALAVSIAPFSLRAAPAGVTAVPLFYTTVQQDTATLQVTQALKKAGAPDIKKASPKQLSSAVAAVITANRTKKSFLGALAYTLVKARPDMTMPIAMMLMADLTPPGQCPLSENVDEIVRAIIAANPAAAPQLTWHLIEQYPCRIAVITRSAVGEAPADATQAVVAAAIGAAPAGERITATDAARQAGATVADIPINPALTMPMTNPSGTSSVGTINPANISGDGSVSTPIQTNSPDNVTGS